MPQYLPEETFQAINQITKQFSLYECDDCVKAIMHWLKANGIEGKILKLRTQNIKEEYIISTWLEQLGIIELITETGTHYGVEVLGKVFDNLSREGMNRLDWLNDFHCQSEQFIIEELENL